MRPDFRRIVFHAASPFRPFWIDGLREGGGRRSKVFRGVCACMSLSRSGRVPDGFFSNGWSAGRSEGARAAVPSADDRHGRFPIFDFWAAAGKFNGLTAARAPLEELFCTFISEFRHSVVSLSESET